MYRQCTCRALSSLAAQTGPGVHAAKRHTISPRGIAGTSSNGSKAFSALTSRHYPRQATPFRASKDAKVAEEDLEGSDLQEASANVQQPQEASTSAQAWYLSESPSPSTASSSTTRPSSSSEKTLPTPPAALPSYLRPLWDHVYESPFLDQKTINFIDARTADSNVAETDMDASVTSWVDWVVVASLRRGRERGIRGASDGAKDAMKSCLRAFDAELAAQEGSTSSTPTKRKKRMPPVSVEGLDVREPQWCLVDGGKAVMHVMTERARKTWEVEGVASAFAAVEPDATHEEEAARLPYNEASLASTTQADDSSEFRPRP